MRLSEAEIGREFAILGVRIAREVGRRLADMGFTEGARVRVVRGGAFRGPLQVRIRDYDVLLRRCEAAGIEVEPSEPPPSERAVQDGNRGLQHRRFGGHGRGRWAGFPPRRGGPGNHVACPDCGEARPGEAGE